MSRRHATHGRPRRPRGATGSPLERDGVGALGLDSAGQPAEQIPPAVERRPQARQLGNGGVTRAGLDSTEH